MENSSVVGSHQSPNQVAVLGAGILTSALALFGVSYLDNHVDDFHAMGYYLDYIIPIGAILVGLAAGIGYGLASWLTGTKITFRVLCVIVALLLACYFAARYIEFLSLHLADNAGKPIPFWFYFDFVTRSFAWKNEHDSGTGAAFGAWGYGMLALEIGGFVLGGLIIPLALRIKPYCDNCQIYMRGKNLGLLPASIVVRKFKKTDIDAKTAYDRELEEAFQKGKDLVEQLQLNATSIKPKEFGAILAPYQAGQKVTAKLPIRITVGLAHCPNCHRGLASASFQAGQGREIKTTPIFKVEVAPAFVEGFDPGVFSVK